MHGMTKREFTITDEQQLRDILDSAKVLRLGLAVDNVPYIYPMNYGYRMEEGRLTLYLHSAAKGKKLELIPEGQFNFQLSMPQADGTETVLETAANDADGKIRFSKLVFTNGEEGTYTYRVREVKGSQPGYTYDSRMYDFTLNVQDNLDGTMSVTADGIPAEGLTFQNPYSDKTSISVQKVWQDEDDKLSVRPESVTVELYRNGEKQTEIVLNAENEWQKKVSPQH